MASTVARRWCDLPGYEGLEWVGGHFPTECEAWPKFSTRRLAEMSGDRYDISREEMRHYANGQPWVWPECTVSFICDIHADTDAFFRSMVASGRLAKTGPHDEDFQLLEPGEPNLLVVGGDCFDKGPSTLRLLRAVRAVMDRGMPTRLLAGNHDVRALVGFHYAGRREPEFAHLFVRMGKKIAPLFKELFDTYVAGSGRTYAADDAVRERLFPPESWFTTFPEIARELMRAEKIEKEVRRIREKTVEIAACARDLGMSLGELEAALDAARDVFMAPDGEFAWFFRDMELSYRAGSFLFIHGGIDDQVAAWLREGGVEGLNARFRHLLDHDPFTLYHGPLGNTFRTKYRPSDFPFTDAGVRDVHAAGVYAIVHGHKSIDRGQRIVPRRGLVNIECDACVNRNTRRYHGLSEPGGAVTVFRPNGSFVGISTDYPYAKVLVATDVLEFMAIV